MINHRNLKVKQIRNEDDGSAYYRIWCEDCDWYVTVGGFFGQGKDCPEA